jgi:hypothetical protein
MKYGRTVAGDRWHAVIGDEGNERPLCFDNAAATGSTVHGKPVTRMKLVDIRDGNDPAVTRDDICGNCAAAFRLKGSKARRVQMRAKAARTRKQKDTYEPRNKLDE